MSRPKTPKVVAEDARQILARNLRALLNVAYADESNKPLALAQAVGIGKATVQRILTGTHAPTLDMLWQIASHFKIPMWRLLLSPEDAANIIDARDVVKAAKGSRVA